MEKSKMNKVEREMLDSLVRDQRVSTGDFVAHNNLSSINFAAHLLESMRPHKSRLLSMQIYSNAACNDGSANYFARMLRKTLAGIYTIFAMPPQVSRAIEEVHGACGMESALEASSIIYYILHKEKDHNHLALDVSYTLSIVAVENPNLMGEALYSIGISKGNPSALMIVTGKLREKARGG